MTPDRFFLKELRRYDRRLSVRWNRERERWQILRSLLSANRLYERTFVVMTVQQDDGSYRALDQRTLDALAAADTWRHGMHALRRMEDANRRREEAIDREFSGFVQDVAKEHRRQIVKELDASIGALNVPRQDLMIDEDAPRRRGEWMGGQRRHPRTGRRHPQYARVLEV